MNEVDLNFNFSTFKLAVVISAILLVMKLAGWADISMWIILLPLIICVGLWFLMVFLIGLFTLYLFIKQVGNEQDESESTENKS